MTLSQGATANKDDKPEASFRKRYVFKLMANLVGLGVGIGTQSIVPRALGPALYGDFSFLTSFFQQVLGFLNLNSSTAFYTKLSQRQQDKGLVVYYLFLLASMGAILCVLLTFCLAAGLRQRIWPDQHTSFIILSALWAFLMFIIMVLGDMSDAYGITVRAETMKMSLKIFSFFLVVILFWRQWLSLMNFFLYQLAVLFLTIWFLSKVINEGMHPFSNSWRLTKVQLGAYTSEFSAFCMPLVAFTALSIVGQMLDRWFIQSFSGSVEQGYYGLAYQVGALSFLFASAMVPLVSREFSIAFGKQDTEELGRVFSRSAPMLYAIVAYFSCFLAVEARNVVLLFGGDAYTGAVVTIAIMCFYPIHQTYGQLNGSVFFATNRTIAYRNIGIFISVVGLPLTLVLLGPKKFGALQIGAAGLAAKLVFLQILSVNIQLWYNIRLMNLSFKYFLGHQLLVVAAFTTAAIVCSYTVRTLLGHSHFGVQFLVSGFFYTLCITCLGIFFPRLFAARREEITNLLTWGKRI